METRKRQSFTIIIATASIATILSVAYLSQSSHFSQHFPSLFARPKRDLISTKEYYSANFANISLQVARRILNSKLTSVRISEPQPPYPPKSVKLSKGRSVAPILENDDGTLIRGFMNPLRIPTRHGSEIFFNTFEHAFFTGDGHVIRVDEATYYDIGGGCCEKDWTSLLGKTVDLSSSKTTYSELKFRAVLVLNQHHAVTYFHVINDIVRKYLYSLPLIEANPDLLVSITESPVSRKLLAFLGLPRTRIVSLKAADFNSWIGAGLLIYPPSRHQLERLEISTDSMVFNVSAVLWRWSLELHGSSQSGVMAKEKPFVVLIERAVSRNFWGDCKEPRCVKNFNGFLRSLRSRLDLDVRVFKATSDVTTTLALFSRASAVIGIHGAGFQNIMFCKPNTTIIEIGFEPFYGGLSRMFQLDYHCLLMRGLRRESYNLIIDVDKYVNAIQTIVQKSLSNSSRQLNNRMASQKTRQR